MGRRVESCEAMLAEIKTAVAEMAATIVKLEKEIDALKKVKDPKGAK